MVKKALAILLCAVLLISVSGCGNAEDTIPMGKPAFTYDNETTVDGMLVREKKFDYENKNVVILQVTNQTDTDYDLTVRMDMFNEAGEKLGTVEKEFTGFAAGYQNYFLFQPGIAFESFAYTLTTTPFEGTAYAPYVKFESPDGDGRIGYLEIGPRPVSPDTSIIALYAMYFKQNTYSETLWIGADFVLFDNRGEIYQINTLMGDTVLAGSEASEQVREIAKTDTLWKDRKEYQLPEELQGDVTGLVAVKQVDIENWNKRPA